MCRPASTSRGQGWCLGDRQSGRWRGRPDNVRFKIPDCIDWEGSLPQPGRHALNEPFHKIDNER